MALDHALISQFAKIVNENKKQNTEATVYGTVMVDGNGNKYVKLDGSDQLTPISEDNQPSVDITTANANEGDRVSVLIKNHTATVTGNVSSPSVRDGDFQKLNDQVTEIKKFDIVIAEKVQADEAYFKKLLGDEVVLGTLEASNVSITDLIATKAKIDEMIVNKLTITDILAKKIDTDIVVADTAIVEKLTAANADILSLIADKATIEDLIANKATINSLIAEKLDVTWANIDFSQIDIATIGQLFSTSGIIKDLVTETGTVTGELVGVTIKGDRIEGNTIVADKLVIKGEDGLYYKLNAGINGITEEQLSSEEFQNGLHGDAIIAHTITAEKINVSDLVAFGATIGGFHITAQEDTIPGAIYSGSKNSIHNPLNGIYLDTDGQVAFGNDNSFLKFYKDEEGKYKLQLLFGRGFTADENGLLLENPNSVMKTRFTDNGLSVYKSDEETLVADDTGVKAINLHAKNYLIVGDNSRFENYGKKRTGCFWFGN